MNQCLLCEGKVQITSGYNQTFSSDGKILQCEKCKSCQVYPLPESKVIDEFYQQEWSNDPLNMNSALKNIFKTISCVHMYTKNYFRWPFVKPYLKKEDKILEIGAGDGSFLTFLRRKEFKHLFAVEPAVQFEKELKKKKISLLWDGVGGAEQGFPHFANAQVGKARRQDPRQSLYDICFAFHVLEHVRDPLDFLHKVKEYLKPGGIFLGEVPNVPFSVNSLTAAEKETVFNNVHLFHYSREGLKKIFKKAGFKNIICAEIGFGKKGIRRFFPKANCHFIHPSFKVPVSIKIQSFFHAIESILLPESRIVYKEKGYGEPNDFIFFRATA